MSIFDSADDHMKNMDEMIKERQYIEKRLSVMLRPGFVRCVVFEPQSEVFLEKSCRAYGLSGYKATFSCFVLKALENSVHDLKKYSQRRVISLDCCTLKKGDAYSFMSMLSKVIDDAVVILENVTRIPEGDPAVYDDRQYVENLLIRSWKNENVFVDNMKIYRSKLTIVLTCPPEDRDILMRVCGLCSYAWNESLL